MSASLDAQFDEFDKRISLKTKQVERINSAWRSLGEYLEDALHLDSGQILLQGSCANGSAIEPVNGGEYDVDLVCVIPYSDVTSDAALDNMTAVLSANGMYEARLTSPRAACVRLEYAEDEVGKFHVDVVPVRKPGSAGAPLDAPRRREGWHGTAPSEYTEWCRVQGLLYLRTVKVLKRWRDENQQVHTAVKSIILQVLVAQHMPRSSSSVAEAVATTLRRMHVALVPLDSPPRVPNPVLSSEDLARRWTGGEFAEFVAELAEAVSVLDEIDKATDIDDVSSFWSDLLGSGFPTAMSADLGLVLASEGHARTPEQEGWIVSLDPRYRIEIAAFASRHSGSRAVYRPYISDAHPLLAGTTLRFRAKTAGPGDAEVWWQVTNTGGHARDSGSLRGGYFLGKELSGERTADPRDNWENTAYTGKHWCSATLVRDGIVVAQSNRLFVSVLAPRVAFRM